MLTPPFYLPNRPSLTDVPDPRLMTWQCGVGVSVRNERGHGHGVVAQLLATKGGGQKVAEGGDDDVSSFFAL